MNYDIYGIYVVSRWNMDVTIYLVCMNVFIISFKLNACIGLFHVIVPFIYSFMYYRINFSCKRDSQ